MSKNELSRLCQAVENMTIVLEGINNQMYLLREELIRSRTSQDDLIENDVTFRAVLMEEVYHLLNDESWKSLYLAQLADAVEEAGQL